MSNWKWNRLLSFVLVLVMVFQMLPLNAFAASSQLGKKQAEISSEDTQIDSEQTTIDMEESLATSCIVDEVVEKRTEFTKEFTLNNGLHMSAVYTAPVHFEENGEWEEIDNTLIRGSGNTFQNTAGVWDVRFPQELSGDQAVSITKNGHTFRFYMIGEVLDAELPVPPDEAEITDEPVQEEIAADDFLPPAEEPTEETAPAVSEEPSETTQPESTEVVVPGESDAELPADEESTEEEAEGEVTANETFTEASVAEESVTDGDAELSETAAEESEPAELPSTSDGTGTEEAVSPNEEPVPEETAVSTEASAPEETTAPTETSEPEETSAPTEESEPEETTIPAAEPVPEETITPANAEAANSEIAEIIDLAGFGNMVQKIQTSRAEVVQMNLMELQEESEFPELITEKNFSRLQYANVYEDTDIIYDLSSNQLKESIVIGSYQNDVLGYRYYLDTGTLTPVLTDAKEIHLADEQGTIQMVMPAPYLMDAEGEYCSDVSVDLRDFGEGYVLTYLLPDAWMKAADRQFPVILDPIVSAELSLANIKDTTVYSTRTTYASPNEGVIQCGYSPTQGIMRFYIKYVHLPELTAADNIVYANLRLYKPYNSGSKTVVEVHKVTADWNDQTMNWSNQAAYNSKIEDFVDCQAAGNYNWNVTEIVRSWYAGNNYGLMMKNNSSVENGGVESWKQFYSSEYNQISDVVRPALTVCFRNNNGLESYWDYTTASAGRAGTGYVNEYTGNLVWEHTDMGFGGNRMPVTIQHYYNANDSQENLFGMGYGWRTNFNQRVYAWSANSNYYVWEDADGTDHYFAYSSSGTYKDEDGLDLTLTTTGSGTTKYAITDKYGNHTYFDTYGRLSKIENNQATKSSITVTYSSESGPYILSIRDGAGRQYRFHYNGVILSDINYMGTGSTDLETMYFAVTGSQPTTITYPDGSKSYFTYGANNLLTSAKDSTGYSINYTYTSTVAGRPNRVKTITEKSNSTTGRTLSLDYGMNQTKFTDNNNSVRLAQFNNWGNTVCVSDDEGRAELSQFANNNSMVAGGKGNQLTLTSKMQNTVNNLFNDNSFEQGSLWASLSSAATISLDTTTKYLGGGALKLVSTGSSETGAKSAVFSVPAGKSYTFSAYVKTGAAKAWLAINDGSKTVKGEAIPANSGWNRYEVTYTNTTTAAKSITARILVNTAGTTYMDCVQLEANPVASRYNLVQNGDWATTFFWSPKTGRTTLSPAAAPGLDSNVYTLTGNPRGTNRCEQTLYISGSAGDSFVLGGWAKGYSVPLVDQSGNDRSEFGLIATVYYTDGTNQAFTAHFNPCVDIWQFTSTAIVARSAYSSIKVSMAYDYNCNTAWFDGIQLFKEQYGTSYTYDSNGNVTSVKDLRKQTTAYEYSNNNLTKATLPAGGKLTYTYDNYHNVKTATTDTGAVYTFAYDTYGNNTSVSIGSGTSKITSSATYTSDGNRLATTEDAAGKVTTYSYNANTNVLEWVKAPNDTDATKTTYTYDAMYRMASAVKDPSSGGLNLSANYTYTNDYLTGVQTPSTQYSFTYGAFGQRTSVKIGSGSLAAYTYTGQNHLLSTLDYGNGDRVNYTYDSKSRVTKQTYEDSTYTSFLYDNCGQLASITDSKTGLTTKYLDDLTGRSAGYLEQSSQYSNGTQYGYDVNNNITQRFNTILGTVYKVYYAYDSENRIKTVNDTSVYKDYTYDSYGRVSKRVSRLDNTALLTNNITYRSPSGTATTGQIATYALTGPGYNKTFSYTYDNNGNILTVSDGTNTTSYVYDKANQLLRENNQAAGKTWTYAYDNAGNILSKTEYAYTTGTLGTALSTKNYTYSDQTWGDLLTSYNGTAITYDTIGNPLNDGTRTYTWERGRRLASLTTGGSTWNQTYSNDGLRIGRTNGSSTYTYYYSGSDLRLMTKDNYRLHFVLAPDGSPVTVTYRNTTTGAQDTYYYVLNPQGDVIALLNTSGAKVVEYTYDAWGNILTTTGSLASTLGAHNPFRYRGYIYDQETNLYYLQSRFYNPQTGRFINADNQLASDELLGMNLFAYCSNNPVNRVDPTGEAWWHWAIGAAVVAACAVATVVTCGGFAAAATAVCMVGNGIAAATTASTVAAAALIGSATVYGTAVLAASTSSNSVEEFNAQGNWGTVAATAGGAVFNGAAAYAATRTPTTTVYRSVSSAEAQDIKNTGQFNLAPGGMESKQFGFNLSETRQFGNMMGQNTIVSARVPNSMLNQLYTGGVDTSIFRAGTLTVYGDQLGAFNQAVSGTIKFMP